MEDLQELPVDDWPEYFAAFSRAHRGWLVRMWVVDTVGLESGMLDNSSMVIRDLALWDIATEVHGDRTDLLVMARHPDATAHSEHPIRHIDSVRIESEQDGEVSGFFVGTEDMQTTVLRFRAAPATRDVDGLTPQELP